MFFACFLPLFQAFLGSYATFDNNSGKLTFVKIQKLKECKRLQFVKDRNLKEIVYLYPVGVYMSLLPTYPVGE